MKSKSERYRIRLSRLAAAVVLFFICTTRSSWEINNYENITTILFFIGVILLGVAALGRLWCSLYIAGYKTHHLIMEGPYSACRNPLYFFSAIGLMGVGFATETFSFPIAFIIIFSLYYPFVIRSEENRLQQVHGDSFYEYKKKVPSFIPRFKAFSEPENYSVKPVLFRKHVFDAVWFIWIIGIIEILEELKDIGFLPSLWCIY
jgi:protein-S-isoprenylcysteine O-methyltransferase Ste14